MHVRAIMSHWPQWLFRRVRILATRMIEGFLTHFLTAAHSRPFIVRLADHVDATLSRLAMIEPFVWGDMQVPVPVPASATRPSGPSRTRTQTKRASPYPRGKDNSQIIGSRPSDVEHTVQSTTGGCSRRYFDFVLSISSH